MLQHACFSKSLVAYDDDDEARSDNHISVAQYIEERLLLMLQSPTSDQKKYALVATAYAEQLGFDCLLGFVHSTFFSSDANIDDDGGGVYDDIDKRHTLLLVLLKTSLQVASTEQRRRLLLKFFQRFATHRLMKIFRHTSNVEQKLLCIELFCLLIVQYGIKDAPIGFRVFALHAYGNIFQILVTSILVTSIALWNMLESNSLRSLGVASVAVLRTTFDMLFCLTSQSKFVRKIVQQRIDNHCLFRSIHTSVDNNGDNDDDAVNEDFILPTAPNAWLVRAMEASGLLLSTSTSSTTKTTPTTTSNHLLQFLHHWYHFLSVCT